MISLIDDSVLTDIGNSIREKLGTENTYLPNQMAEAIQDISSGDGVKKFTQTYGYSAAHATGQPLQQCNIFIDKKVIKKIKVLGITDLHDFSVRKIDSSGVEAHATIVFCDGSYVKDQTVIDDFYSNGSSPGLYKVTETEIDIQNTVNNNLHLTISVKDNTFITGAFAVEYEFL